MNRLDARQLKRWNISPSRIPADTDVSFLEANLWTQYHRYIIGAMCFVFVQMLLISALLLQRARRRAAELDIRSKESELRGSYEQVRQLAGKLINAHEEERSRIARELHDDVGQKVASLSISLSSLKRRALASDESVGNELAHLQAKTTCLAKDLRDLSHDLHQGAIEHISLPEALRERCEQINQESNIRLKFEVAEGWIEVPDNIKLCLYRVAQEALRNIAKHANAKTGVVTIAHENGQVRMTISDDGLGFVTTKDPIGRQGIGLLSMRERVRMLGGSFDVSSTLNCGTVATIAIPTGDKH
jgi:signal transduction histidine kinase